jgi:hypothetical protein
MLHNPKPSFLATREYTSPTSEARRLRLEYNRLQRRLGALEGKDGAAGEIEGLRAQIERTARELSQVRADSVHAVEAKLRVALDLKADAGEAVSHRLMSSALSDLHYLAMLTPPPTD